MERSRSPPFVNPAIEYTDQSVKPDSILNKYRRIARP